MGHHVYLSAPGLALGDMLLTTTARATGLISAQAAAATNQVGVLTRPEKLSASDLVDFAVKDAISESPAYLHHEKLGAVYHAAAEPSAPTAAQVMANLDSDEALHHPAITLHSGDQGVIDALYTAQEHLNRSAARGATCAVVSSSATWSGTAEDRWRQSAPPGDGAGAVIVSNERGPLRLLATARYVEPRLTSEGYDSDTNRLTRLSVLARVLADVLAQAKLKKSAVRYLVTPFGTRRPEHTVGRALGQLDAYELERHIENGRIFGRLGPVDLLAGLNGLMRHDGPLRLGDHILMLAVGDHGSVGAAVLRAQ